MTNDYRELSAAEAEAMLEIILAQIDVLIDDMRRSPSATHSGASQ